VRAVVLSTKDFDLTRGDRKAREDHNLEKRKSRGLRATVWAPEYSKTAGGQKTREVRESAPGILTKMWCQKVVSVLGLQGK